jgi:alpha-L-fucosidase 2
MMSFRLWISLLGVAALGSPAGVAASFTPAPLAVWYGQAGRSPLTEGLPIGNGRIGALILGDAAKERIVLDEDSLWVGGNNPNGGYKPDPDKFGTYQFLGELSITAAGAPVPVDYHRDLDLATATAHVVYKANGGTYEREAFASHPAEVMVFRFAGSRSHGYNVTIGYADSRQASATAEGNRITCAAVLPNGLKHETQILVQAEGGSVEAADGKLVLHDCDAFTLIVGAGTDYAMDFAHGYRGEDPHAPGQAAPLPSALF